MHNPRGLPRESPSKSLG
ncbi:unnamed protein product, partial [Didymodactylos carnosus]